MKIKIFVILVVLILCGFLVYNYYKSDPLTDLEDEEVVISEEEILGKETPVTPGAVISDESENYNISGRYANINLLGSEEVNAYINSYSSSFKAQADEDLPALREEGSAVDKYTLEIDAVSYAGVGYVFHVLNIGEYTGGASSNAVVETFAYRVSDGLRVSLDEFVATEDQADFMKTLRKELIDHGKENSDSGGVFVDDVGNLTFSDIKTFYVSGGNLVVVFSKYEIAPGSAGIIEIKIPLSDL